MARVDSSLAAGPIHGSVLAVVSYYNARPPANLISLLDSMRSFPAGWPFEVRVVVNRELPRDFVLPPRHRAVDVVQRENLGFNIGAWDHGWRIPPPFEAYLFLQDECRILRADWLGAFVRRAADPRLGLLGERLSPPWNATWDELARREGGQLMEGHEIDGRPARRLECYFRFFMEWGIQRGEKGDHLQTLVLFARRAVLGAIDGFPSGRNKGEAIAAEIAISKKVQALGLEIAEVGPEPFTYIAHPQWVARAAEHLPKKKRPR
jgi:hypothetical protein